MNSTRIATPLASVPRRHPLSHFPLWLGLAWLAVLAEHPGQALETSRWRWSNPLPHGNNVLDMFVSGNLAVQVGDGGSVYVQWDGGRWTPAVTGVSSYLRGVTMFGDRFIVVGESGCILWSDDGKNFRRAELSPATTDWFEGVAASSTRAVAVGDNGSIYTSTNGMNWAKANSGSTAWLRGVAAGQGSFVAVGEDGTILRSAGGLSWTKVTSGTTAHFNRVRYLETGGSGSYVAVGEGGVAMRSASGSSGWAALNVGTTNILNDAADNGSGLLLVGDQELRYRPNGATAWSNQIDLSSNAPPAWVYLSAQGEAGGFLVAGRSGLLVRGEAEAAFTACQWTVLPDSSHAWLWDITQQSGTYVAVGDLATIQTSLDGVLWASEVVPSVATNAVLLGVGGTTNLLLAVGSAGTVLASPAGVTNVVMTNQVGGLQQVTNVTMSTLGILWSAVPEFTTNTLQGVGARGDLYVVCGDEGAIFTSEGGTNWTAQASPTTRFLSSVAAFPDGWVAVGERGTLLRSGADGVDWTAVPMGTTNWLYRVRWVGDRLVVVGQNGSLYTSPDGINWNKRSTGTTRWLNDVTYFNGAWWVVGNQGTLLVSTNVVQWSLQPVPTVKSLFGVSSAGGQLMLAGVEGALLRNQVVPRESPVNFLSYKQSLAPDTSITNALPVMLAYDLFLFGGETDQFFDFQSSTNLSAQAWTTNGSFEVFDISGTLYLLRNRYTTNTPPQEFYRTSLIP